MIGVKTLRCSIAGRNLSTRLTDSQQIESTAMICHNILVVLLAFLQSSAKTAFQHSNMFAGLILLILLNLMKIASYRRSRTNWNRFVAQESPLRVAFMDSDYYRLPDQPISTQLAPLINKRMNSFYKHLNHHIYPAHTRKAFDFAVQNVDHFYEKYGNRDNMKRVILDSGCGKGRSSVILARDNPLIPVIGIDRSITRLSSNRFFNDINSVQMKSYDEEETITSFSSEIEKILSEDAENSTMAKGLKNLILIRAELSSFWLLACLQTDWLVHSHYMLHPNPYPKAKLLSSRLYGESIAK
jgi:tRNA G46 methylase TrmB